MNSIKLVFVSMLFGVFGIIEVASAASMYCGNYVISDGGRHGPGKYEVLKKCGEPTERFGNTWVYDRKGAGKKVLTFHESGLLKTIR